MLSEKFTNEQMQVYTMVNTLVSYNLSCATKDFDANPSGDNWNATIKAMLVFQQWRKADSEKKTRAIEACKDELFYNWPHKIVEAISGRTIDQLLREVM